MTIIIPEISHGHGLSFKKGITNGLLYVDRFKNTLPEGGHSSSYKDYEIGESLKDKVASQIKVNHVGE